MNVSLETWIEKHIKVFPQETIGPFLEPLLQKVQKKSQAVLIYGSSLSEVTRSNTSTPDFYILVNRYRDFHDSWVHAFLNFFLPPNIYHFTVGDQIAKFNVIQTKTLQKETSEKASDCYQLGRFSKRMAVGWARSPELFPQIAQIQAQAMRTIAKKVFFLMSETFSLESFIQESLRFSYLADVRVEAQNKVDKLFQANREFYEKAYSLILSEMTESPLGLMFDPSTQTYRKTCSSFLNYLEKLRVQWFITNSQLRAQLRWPKSIFTVANWVDYMILKIQRTQGIEIHLTPKQKKLWFIYGWKYFFLLRKKKLIK